MNASSLQMKLSYKEKIISKVAKFNRKHKSLSFLGMAYAVIAIVCYNIGFYFYRNVKRFTSLACILLFFVSSSSFSYPGMALNISFSSGSGIDGEVDGEALDLSEAEIAESSAELAVIEDVDSAVLEEALQEIESGSSEDEEAVGQMSVTDILESGDDGTAATAVGGNNITSAESVSFSSDDWKILLVNKQHPIPDDYDFPLGTISGSLRCDERVIQPLLDMLKAARADGINLVICSPYRDMDRQTMLFTNKVNKYMAAGMSYMDSYNLASQAVTVPGSSEHQIGLAIDIVSDGYSSLDEGFGDTDAGKWLAANSYKYGFILRYPLGKEDITSIEYEPWHFRYVGVDAATVIAQNDICLEEFWSIYVD